MPSRSARARRRLVRYDHRGQGRPRLRPADALAVLGADVVAARHLEHLDAG